MIRAKKSGRPTSLVLGIGALAAVGFLGLRGIVSSVFPTNIGSSRPRVSATAVTFKAAGHEWQTEPAPQNLNWESAKSYCAGLAGGGWRLPDKDELKALYDAKSTLAGNTFIKGLNGGWYWSSSPHGNGAWLVVFDSGDVANDGRNGEYAVRCVR